MPVSYRPMNARNRPMPTAKLCFMLGEIASASQRAHAEQRDDEEDHAADEDRAEALLPRRCRSAARPKAMKAFSPMYGATAIGRLA